jgi:aquaporin Z
VTTTWRRLGVEVLGTAWLVLGGCGAAVLAADFPGGRPVMGIGLLGVALAFGLTVLTMASALGDVSGGHFNPAVTTGLATAGRFPARDVGPYVLAQVVGAIAGAAILYGIASGREGFDVSGGFASNGYGAHSPSGYGLAAGLLSEAVLTFFFVLVILAATRPTASTAIAPVTIGLALTLVNLVSIPVTNCSVNPARSTGPAVFVGGWALAQLWAFWVAPLVGGAVAGLAWRALAATRPAERPVVAM